MTNYQETRGKLAYIQLNLKNKTGTISRINKKRFQDEKLPRELFLTSRQTTNIRNTFAKNMSADIKLSQVQISKIVQSGGSVGSWLANLDKKKALD